MDYLNPFPRQPPSPEDKVLYEKCKDLMEKLMTEHKPVIITSSFRSRSRQMEIFLTNEKLNGLEYMHISGKRHVSVDDIILSVQRTEKAIQEGRLRPAPKATDHVPEHVTLIMNKTRLGENNGI